MTMKLLDYYNDPVLSTMERQKPPKAPQAAPFPSKLYQLLEEAEEHRHDDIASWLPGGHTFRVHSIKKFCSELMAKYFKKQTKFNSFTRQVSSIDITQPKVAA